MKYEKIETKKQRKEQDNKDYASLLDLYADLNSYDEFVLNATVKKPNIYDEYKLLFALHYFTRNNVHWKATFISLSILLTLLSSIFISLLSLLIIPLITFLTISFIYIIADNVEYELRNLPDNEYSSHNYKNKSYNTNAHKSLTNLLT